MSLFDQLNKQTATVEIQQLLGFCFGYTIGRSDYTEGELEALHNTLAGCSLEGSLMGVSAISLACSTAEDNELAVILESLQTYTASEENPIPAVIQSLKEKLSVDEYSKVEEFINASMSYVADVLKSEHDSSRLDQLAQLKLMLLA